MNSTAPPQPWEVPGEVRQSVGDMQDLFDIPVSWDFCRAETPREKLEEGIEMVKEYIKCLYQQTSFNAEENAIMGNIYTSLGLIVETSDERLFGTRDQAVQTE